MSYLIRNQFSVEYFTFMRKLIQCNAPFVTVAHGEKLSKGKLVGYFIHIL